MNSVFSPWLYMWKFNLFEKLRELKLNLTLVLTGEAFGK
jgi:hypothetical protein